MCDVNVFVVKNGVEEKVLENVDLIEEVAGGMRLVNIFGEAHLRAKWYVTTTAKSGCFSAGLVNRRFR